MKSYNKNIFKYLMLIALMFAIQIQAQNLVLENAIISTTETYSENSITLGPNLTIASSGHLVLYTNSLAVKPELYILNGGSLHMISAEQPNSIKEDEILVPESFEVSQNYPNPFNPVTTIKYTLPQSTHIKIDVYNVLGQHLATLLNGFKQAGFYEMHFNATKYPSGIYFYSIQAGSYHKIMKMMLVK